jgi:PPOX class probable F420-dependent enzyme
MTEPTPSRRLKGRAILQDPLVRELLESRLVGVLATLDPDGAVHAVPMWFALAADSVVLATGSDSRKARNLGRDRRATLVVHDSRAGSEICGVSLRGTIEVERGADASSLVERVHRRYVDPAALRLLAVHAFLAGDDVALRLAPEQAFTWDERANEATLALRRAGGALPLVPTSPR